MAPNFPNIPNVRRWLSLRGKSAPKKKERRASMSSPNDVDTTPQVRTFKILDRRNDVKFEVLNRPKYIPITQGTAATVALVNGDQTALETLQSNQDVAVSVARTRSTRRTLWDFERSTFEAYNTNEKPKPEALDLEAAVEWAQATSDRQCDRPSTAPADIRPGTFSWRRPCIRQPGTACLGHEMTLVTFCVEEPLSGLPKGHCSGHKQTSTYFCFPKIVDTRQAHVKTPVIRERPSQWPLRPVGWLSETANVDEPASRASGDAEPPRPSLGEIGREERQAWEEPPESPARFSRF